MKHKYLIAIVLLIAIVVMVIMNLSILNKNKMPIFIFASLTGIFVSGAYVPMLDLSIQISKPLNPSHSKTLFCMVHYVAYLTVGEFYSKEISK